MTKLRHEPLVHFIIFGALLFAGHNLWQNHIAKTDYTITVSTEEMERQSLIFAGENRRKPTDDDLKALLFSYVEEEALVREAERMGLGENDTIIRRRLAQKMRFLIENVDAPALPDEIELEAYFKTNIESFIRPEKREFSHIYLSPEVHGNNLEIKAQTLIQKTKTTDWKSLGDPFIMKRQFESLSLIEVSRLFGPEFANSIFEASDQNWQGPVESAFGLHLIRIDSISDRAIPKFEDVKEDVKRLWQEEALMSANQTRLKTLINKYKVDIEGSGE
jgi:hypothetical protein